MFFFLLYAKVGEVHTCARASAHTISDASDGVNDGAFFRAPPSWRAFFYNAQIHSGDETRAREEDDACQVRDVTTSCVRARAGVRRLVFAYS